MIEPEQQLEASPETGYWLNFSPDRTEIQHDLCGAHDIAGAVCPHCDKHLLRILSLSTSDPALRIDPAKVSIVHLFYCWTCSIPYDWFSYRVGADGGVEILEVPARIETEFGPDGPYDGYTGSFPLRRVSLREQTEAEQAELKGRWTGELEESSLGIFEPRHQVGGYPFIYNPSERNCPKCDGPMKFLAAICDDASGNNPWQDEVTNSFVGNGGVQMLFLFCRECGVISANHSCD